MSLEHNEVDKMGNEPRIELTEEDVSLFGLQETLQLADGLRIDASAAKPTSIFLLSLCGSTSFRFSTRSSLVLVTPLVSV